MVERPQDPVERMRDRMQIYKTETPSAGEPFPDVTLGLLDGSETSIAALAGNVVVIQTGAYT